MRKMPKKGYKQSEEHRRKISQVVKEQWQDEEYCVMMSEVHKGYVASDETRMRMSLSGGGTGIPYEKESERQQRYLIAEWKKIRKEVYKRDNHTCQECGKTDCKVCAHHIDFDSTNNSLDNLVTLCGNCHGKTVGKNHEYWIKYFQEKIGGLKC